MKNSIKQKITRQYIFIISILTVLLVGFFCFVPKSKAEVVPATSFAGGAGTATSPYQISNASEMLYFSNLINSSTTYQTKYYELTADIDLSGISNWTPIGYLTTYNSAAKTGFRGVFNGNNHTVSNCNITITNASAKTSTSKNFSIGLFGAVQGATITNLIIEDMNIEISTTNFTTTLSNDMAVGAISGKILGASTITNCTVNNFTFDDNSMIQSIGTLFYGVGGITGDLSSTQRVTNPTDVPTIVNNAVNNASISTNLSDTKTNMQQYFVGGLAGRVRVHIVIPTNSVFSGTLSGNGYISPTIAGYRLEGVAQTNYTVIAGTNLAESDSLWYYNTTIAYVNPDMNYRVDGNGTYDPIGVETTHSNSATLASLNQNAGTTYHNWLSAGSKLVIDYGLANAVINQQNVANNSVLLTGVLNNYAGNDLTYSWKINNVIQANTTNTITVSRRTISQNIELTIITSGGDSYVSTVVIPIDPNIRLNIGAQRTGLQYALTPDTSLIPVSQNLTYQWKNNNEVVGTGNTYSVTAINAQQSIELVLTDNATSEIYTAQYIVPAATVNIRRLSDNGITANLEAYMLLGETEVSSNDITSASLTWNINNVRETSSNFNKGVQLTTAVQSVSVGIQVGQTDFGTSGIIELSALDLYITFAKQQNGDILASISGTSVDVLNLSDYTYQWYFMYDNQPQLISGATTTSLSGYSDGGLYKFVATNSQHLSLTIEGYFSPKNVIYVNYASGLDTNDGKTPTTPVKTLPGAYTRLGQIPGSSTGTVDTNIIVIMGNYTDNNYGDGTDNVFSIPCYITGKYNNVEYNGLLTMYGETPGKHIGAATKFEYLKISGKSGSSITTETMLMIYAEGNDLTMGKGLQMVNYSMQQSTATTMTGHGLQPMTKQKNVHIIAGHLNYNEEELHQQAGDKCVITIESGSYCRVIGGSRNTDQLNPVSKNQYGTASNPFDVEININYETTSGVTVDANGYSTYNIGLVCAGQTDGSGYFNSEVNITNGTVGCYIGGSLGNKSRTQDGIAYPLNKYIGTTTLNMSGGYVKEMYGGSLGRTVGNSVLIGSISLNISGGTIDGNLYSCGASGETGTSTNSATVDINITGGTINGNVYGGGYGYSSGITATAANSDSGAVFGTIDMDITGGTIDGNVYGGGRGTDAYASYATKQALAKVNGNISLTIGNTARISGSVFGGGDGLPLYPDMAEVNGNVNIEFTNQSNISNNECLIVDDVYGSGANSRLNGNVQITVNEVRLGADLFGGGMDADIIGSVGITLNTRAKVLGSLYGGSRSGDVGTIANENTIITMNIGEGVYIGQNLYGAGEGTTADTYSDVNINIEDLRIGGNIYGAGNSGKTYGNVELNIDKITTTATNSSQGGNIYGGGNNADVEENTEVSVLVGNIIGDVFGGGNLGKVKGNTSLLIGDEVSEDSITVAGVVYAGGRGSNSTTIMVEGNSNATIIGINTNISSYGSIELGAVQGDVNILFREFKKRNSNNRYKNMSGINKATNLELDDSYVYLTGGVQQVTNMILPSGSGMMISEDSSISGNFTGGGLLYLQSEVCFTITGDITQDSQTTTLTLNPEKLLDSSYVIKGSETFPYVEVIGTDNLYNTTDSAFVSGYVTKYDILHKLNSSNNPIYYIARDVEISTYIGATSYVTDEKDYTVSSPVIEAELGTLQDIDIIYNEAFTTTTTIEYTYVGSLAQAVLDPKFHNIRRYFSIQENYVDVVLPVGTKIIIVQDGNYYEYTVTGNNITQIPFSSFKILETNVPVTELNDITENLFVKPDSTVRYDETYRIITDFSDCENKFNAGNYNFNIEVIDGSNESNSYVSLNGFKVENRTYTTNLTVDKGVYLQNDIISLQGTFGINRIMTSNLNGTKLKGVLKITDSSNNVVNMPSGTKIVVGNQEYIVNENSPVLTIKDNLTTQIEDVDISIDMSNVTNSSEKLSAGVYNINIDYYLATGDSILSTKLCSSSTPFNIISPQNFGIKASVSGNENIDKLQEVFGNVTKNISLQVNSGNLTGAYININLQRRTGAFQYETIENTVCVSRVQNLNSIENIAVRFTDSLSNGIYRIVFELRDQYGNSYTSETVNFLIQN